jgi:hypothetical protein
MLAAGALSLTAAFASPEPLTDPAPRLDGLTGASDLLYRPVLGAPIPPRFGPGDEADVLRDRMRNRRKDESPRDPRSLEKNERPPASPAPHPSPGSEDYS